MKAQINTLGLSLYMEFIYLILELLKFRTLLSDRKMLFVESNKCILININFRLYSHNEN